MDDQPLYHQIAESIRRQILEGYLQVGDRLPSVRDLTRKWNCTSGTVQRAYQELARQGLLVSRAGQGTTVSGSPAELHAQPHLRKALLVNHSEAFLLEMLTGGYDLSEIQQALNMAMDRWRSEGLSALVENAEMLRFSGSHDLALAWMEGHFGEIAPGHKLKVVFNGSLGGLMALAEGRADLAGCHLWDVDSDTYNLPFVQRLLPGKRIGLVRLAQRRMGLLVAPGNPLKINTLEDITRAGVQFVNRQAGSGTRVWLDAQLTRQKIDAQAVQGYSEEHLTHSSVARAVAEGRADVGLGLEAAGRAMALDFVFLNQECYDLVIPEAVYQTQGIQMWIAWLRSEAGRSQIFALPGYDAANSTETVWS